jgi:hypothetical protein
MNGLRVYVNQTNKSTPCSHVVFYSRRADGPYYCWRYEEALGRWHFSRVRLPNVKLSVLCLTAWKAIPVTLQAELYEHYLE